MSNRKLELATKLVGIFTQHVGSVTVATDMTVSSIVKLDKASYRTAWDSVLEVMNKQFYKVYGHKYNDAEEGGNGFPTKEKYDQYVETFNDTIILKRKISLLKKYMISFH